MEGEVENLAFNHFGQQSSNWKRAFVVHLRGDEWQIETQDLHPSGMSAKWKLAGAGQHELREVTYFTNGVHTASVEFGDVPLKPRDSISHYLWMMFVSGRYLADRGTNRLPAFFELVASPHFDPNLTQPAEWETIGQKLKFPKFIRYINKDGIPTWDDKAKKIIYAPAPFPYSKHGFTNAAYTLLESTNVGTARVPIRGEFKEFFPGPPMNELVVRRHVTAVVHQIRPSCDHGNLTPELPKKTPITDHRLMSSTSQVGLVTYQVADGRWTTPEQLKKIHARQVRDKLPHRTPYTLIAAFVILLLSPVLVILFKRRRLAQDKGR